MPTVHMTPAEHHALTALLRSGLSRAAADKLGLTHLMDAMSAPYRRELEERGQASHLVARGMPSILVGRYYQGEQVHPSETCMPADWFTWHRKKAAKPTRLVINVTGGAIHAVTADGPVDVLFISNEGDDVHNFDEPCLVPVSQDMADPHAYWRWGTEGGSAEVSPEVIDHFFEQLEG